MAGYSMDILCIYIFCLEIVLMLVGMEQPQQQKTLFLISTYLELKTDLSICMILFAKILPAFFNALICEQAPTLNFAEWQVLMNKILRDRF